MMQPITADTSAYFDQSRNLYRRLWEDALSYDDYVQTAEPHRRERWNKSLEGITLSASQISLLAGFTREVKVIVLSATWCGDCVAQVPIVHRISEASDKVTLRILERDENAVLRDALRLSGAAKVPVAIFLSEDYFECDRVGDRTLASYRAMAQRQLGPACPIGPGYQDEDERTASIREWVEAFERVQLMLRLSPYLRERYGD